MINTILAKSFDPNVKDSEVNKQFYSCRFSSYSSLARMFEEEMKKYGVDVKVDAIRVSQQGIEFLSHDL